MLDIRFAQVKAVAFVLKPSPQAELIETLKKRLGNEMGVYAGEICILDLSSFSESDQTQFPLELEPIAAIFHAVGAQLCEVRTCLKWLQADIEALGLRYEETEPPLQATSLDETASEADDIEAFLDTANAVARQKDGHMGSVRSLKAEMSTKAPPLVSASPLNKEKAASQSVVSLNADGQDAINPSFWPLARKTMVVETPVRSGQKVYARGADLVVLGPVSPGAEVIADGHVLVYGHLRGRALAGANGDANAKVIATCFEPELVAIAGYYLTFEGGLGEEYRCKPTMVVLDNPKEPARVQLKTLNIR